MLLAYELLNTATVHVYDLFCRKAQAHDLDHESFNLNSGSLLDASPCVKLGYNWVGYNESGDCSKANGEPWICVVYGVVVLRWPEGCSMVVVAWQGGGQGQNNCGRRFSRR